MTRRRFGQAHIGRFDPPFSAAAPDPACRRHAAALLRSCFDDVDANCTSAILALFFLVVFSVVIVSSVKEEEVKRLFADIVPLCVFSFDDDDEDADVLAFVFFATKRRFGSLLLVPEASGVR